LRSQEKEEYSSVTNEFLRLSETSKALITYIDDEYVFDKASDEGCSGFDTYHSEKFDALIENTRKAVVDIENILK
jgi:hypothetical protein